MIRYVESRLAEWFNWTKEALKQNLSYSAIKYHIKSYSEFKFDLIVTFVGESWFVETQLTFVKLEPHIHCTMWATMQRVGDTNKSVSINIQQHIQMLYFTIIVDTKKNVCICVCDAIVCTPMNFSRKIFKCQLLQWLFFFSFILCKNCNCVPLTHFYMCTIFHAIKFGSSAGCRVTINNSFWFYLFSRFFCAGTPNRMARGESSTSRGPFISQTSSVTEAPSDDVEQEQEADDDVEPARVTS